MDIKKKAFIPLPQGLFLNKGLNGLTNQMQFKPQQYSLILSTNTYFRTATGCILSSMATKVKSPSIAFFRLSSYICSR